MKRFFLALIIGILVLSGLGAGAIQRSNIKPVFENATFQEPTESLSPRAYTHTVLVEVGTATWCPSCPASNTAWHSIYGSGNYDFEYTELVYDMNPVASARFYDFNPKYVPTSYWDAGQYVYPGTNTATFYNYLDLTGARAVPDLVADLGVNWLGSADIEITYSVQNNEASAYPGRMRIYVIEFVSTQWNDNSGNPYYHGFLDFAYNQPINIPASGSISDTITWDGGAAGYPGITKDNIQVILAVFGNTPHPAYSDPPSGNYFNAYYSDECIAAIPEEQQNNPPEKPTIDGPSKGKVNTSIEYSFRAIDPDGDNIAEYILNWGDGSGDITLAGPFTSGQTVKATHTWTAKANYQITAKAKDINDATGPTAAKSITIPRQKAIYNPFYKVLENHPYIFIILKLVLNQL